MQQTQNGEARLSYTSVTATVISEETHRHSDFDQMTLENRRAARKLLSQINRFRRGELDVEEIQDSVTFALSRIERSEPDLHQPLRDADADLELIRFTVLLENQHDRALERLGQLSKYLLQALQSEE